MAGKTTIYLSLIHISLVGLDSMGRETPIEDTLYFWYKAADTVPVSIYKDNQLIEKVFIPQGTINENSHVIDLSLIHIFQAKAFRRQ